MAFEDEESKKVVLHSEVSAALWLCDVKHSYYCLPNADLPRRTTKNRMTRIIHFDSFAF